MRMLLLSMGLGLLGPLAVLVMARRRGWRRPASLAAVLLLYPALVVACTMGLRARRAAALKARIDAAAASLVEGRWERPVLRGEPVPGNAEDAAEKALQAFADVPDSIDKMNREEQDRIAEAHAEALSRLRDATHGAWAWNTRPKGLDEAEPRIVIRAAVVMRVSARHVAPGECLRIAADLIRLGQDHAAGGGLVQLLLGGSVMEEGVHLVSFGCAHKASRAEREAAARELRILAAHMPPAGHAFAGEPIVGAKAVLTMDTSDGLAAQLTWGERTDAAESFLDEIPAWRSLDGLPHPDALARVKAIIEDRDRSKNAFVRESQGFKLTGYFAHWVLYNAYVRAAAALLQATVVAAATGEIPAEAPDWLRSPELLDPFTGAPLRWDRSERKLTLRSVGLNGRDGPEGPDNDDAGLSWNVEAPPAPR